jgi:ribonuclease P protein component
LPEIIVFDMSDERQTFRKTERLCRTKLISELFETGNAFYTPFFKVVWGISDEEFASPAQIAISVPKRNIRLAVSRNLIKRRIREAYRKNKQVLYDFLAKDSRQIFFIVIFRKNIIPDYQTTENSVTELIGILCHDVKQKMEKC